MMNKGQTYYDLLKVFDIYDTTKNEHFIEKCCKSLIKLCNPLIRNCTVNIVIRIPDMNVKEMMKLG